MYSGSLDDEIENNLEDDEDLISSDSESSFNAAGNKAYKDLNRASQEIE